MRIYLDTETSGLKSHDAFVLEVAAVAIDNGGHEVAAFESLANPGEEALRISSPAALAVNGLALDEIRKAPRDSEVATELRAFLARWPDASYHAYNNDFDVWFLARAPWLLSAKRWGECVMLASMESMRNEGALEHFSDGTAKWPRLEVAAKFFGIAHVKGHRALYDARAAARVHAEILRQRAIALDEAISFFEDIA